MSRFEVEIPVKFLYFTTVDAEDEAQAIDIAYDRMPVNMDHYSLLYRGTGEPVVKDAE